MAIASPEPTQSDARVRASLAEIDRLDFVIENARQSNDPAKMRAAIDELQNSLSAIRANLAAVSAPDTSGRMPMTHGSPKTMDHSHMNMPGGGSPMDHSPMDMPGMGSAPKKPQTNAGSPEEATPARAKDPVCGMEVDTKSAEEATDQGQTYYFCSKADKEKFLGSPEKFREGVRR